MYISLISKSAFSSATENDDKYNYVLLDMVKSKHLGEGGDVQDMYTRFCEHFLAISALNYFLQILLR